MNFLKWFKGLFKKNVILHKSSFTESKLDLYRPYLESGMIICEGSTKVEVVNYMKNNSISIKFLDIDILYGTFFNKDRIYDLSFIKDSSSRDYYLYKFDQYQLPTNIFNLYIVWEKDIGWFLDLDK